MAGEYGKAEEIEEEEGEEKEKGDTPEQLEAILTLGRKRFNRAYDAHRENRERQRTVRKFVWLDEQWGEQNTLAAVRSSRNQSVITVNPLKALHHQVANDQRQNRPAPRIIPVDDGADPEVAKVLTGLMRRVLSGSGVKPPADAAFDTAHGHAVDGGEGYFILDWGWEDADGERMFLFVSRVEDPESVLLDPECNEADFSDARFGFKSQWMDWEVIQARWPNAKKVEWVEGWRGDEARWERDDMLRVCRYRYVEETHPKGGKGAPERKVYDCLMTGAEMLEKTEMPCQWIGMFCVSGDWTRIEGEIHSSGLFHSALGAVMMLNYFRSSLADAVGEIPKAAWLGTPAMFKGFENHYNNAGDTPLATLMYNVDPEVPGGKPERLYYKADVSALVAGGQLMERDIERVTGIYAAGKGEEGNEKSGKALLARQHESDTATFHFADNLGRAQQYLGRCIVDAAGRVYVGDDPRATRILEEDGSDRVIYFRENPDDQPIVYEEITGPATHESEPRLRKGDELQDGEKRTFVYIDPDVGRYDVVLATGPSFSTKRKENAEALVAMAQSSADPVEALVIRYMLADNLDFEGADLYKAAMLVMLPPEVQEVLSESGDDVDPKRELMRVRAALNQSQQKSKELEQMAQQLMEALKQAEQADNAGQRDAMVKVAIAESTERWQVYEADQATARTALQQQGETARAQQQAAALPTPEPAPEPAEG